MEVSQHQVTAAYEQLAAVREQTAVAQDQLEGQIRPAIVVRHGAVMSGGLMLFNVGKGPALHIKLSITERGSAGKRGLDLIEDIGFVEVDRSAETHIRTQGPGANALNGNSLQCEYTSLSGRTHWTVVDFDSADNTRLVATRFYFERRLQEDTLSPR